MYTIPNGTIKKFHSTYYVLIEFCTVDLCCTEQAHDDENSHICYTYSLQNRINSKISEFKCKFPVFEWDFQTSYIAQDDKLFIYFWRPETADETKKRMVIINSLKRKMLKNLLNEFLENNSTSYFEKEKVKKFEKEFIEALYS